MIGTMTLDDLLCRCCDGASQDALELPHLSEADGEVFFCNGHVAIAVPTHELAGTYEPQEAYPKLRVLLGPIRTADVETRVPVTAVRAALERLEKVEEHEEIPCRECNGAGEITCDSCGHESDCEACCGNGYTRGPVIGQTYREWQYVRLLGAIYNPRYLHLLCDIVEAFGSRRSTWSRPARCSARASGDVPSS